MPLSDRDYMRRSPPKGSERRYHGPRDYNLNPIWVLIGLNFALLIIRYVADDSIIRLGLYPDLFWSRPWTLITAMFTHANFWHFLGNMFVLFFFGRLVIMLIGQNWFLLVYFIGGIVGNILFLLLADPYSIAVGASGAVYAIAGTLVVLMPNLRVYLYFLLPMPLWVVVILFFGVWSIPGIFPNIAWQAHLGGLAVGLIAGYFFRRKRRVIY